MEEARRRNSFCARLSRRLCQEKVRASYENVYVQWFIAGLILGNFITNIVEKEIDPWNDHYPEQWIKIELAWNIIFVFELVWNMWGHWYSSLRIPGHFLSSGWNIFDTIVVSVSLPSMTGAELPPGTDNLRIVRAFRVFRLFNRIKSLRKILASLANALPGMLNAAAVQVLVMCIFAVLAVDLFGTFGAEPCDSDTPGNRVGKLTCWKGQNRTVSLVTPRGMTYGEEYYSTFTRALFTCFQVLTGESWGEAVARPLVMSDDLWHIGFVYHLLFTIICAIVLVNVVVAVLLDKMMDPGPMETQLETEPSTMDPSTGDKGEAHPPTRPYTVQSAWQDISDLKQDLHEMQSDMARVLECLVQQRQSPKHSSAGHVPSEGHGHGHGRLGTGACQGGRHSRPSLTSEPGSVPEEEALGSRAGAGVPAEPRSPANLQDDEIDVLPLDREQALVEPLAP